jgi:hypothetical protein
LKILLWSLLDCVNFGHKVVNYRSYAKNRSNYTRCLNNSYPTKYCEEYNKNQNSFGSFRNEVDCYKCNNFGHIEKDCRLIIPPRESKKKINRHTSKPQEIWKRNKNQFSLSLQAQHKKSDWYVGSGFSKNMTGDWNMFTTLKKERDGSISFGNNHPTKIICIGTIKLGSKDAMVENVLLVEYMKQNLLSVSQMCVQGHTLQFDSKKCETRKEGS